MSQYSPFEEQEDKFAPNFFYTLDDVEDKLLELRSLGYKKGSWVGHSPLYERMSIIRGSYTIMYAAPTMGKTQFLFEVLMNLAEFEGKKIAIISSETGSVKEIYAELLWVYLRKPFIKGDWDYASAEEVKEGIAFLRNHFYVIDSGLNDMSVKGFYRQVQKLQDDLGIKIDVCGLDPYTEFTNDTANGMRDDQAIASDLNAIRKHSSAMDLHSILTMHVTKPQLRVVDGVKVPMPPDPTEISGGQQSYRKGMQMVYVHRQDKRHPDTLEYLDGHAKGKVLIGIVKAKPKRAGSQGVVEMYYDKFSNRYYTYDTNTSSRVYAHANPNPEISEDYVSETIAQTEFEL